MTLASVVGNDIDGNNLLRLCEEAGIGTSAMLQSNSRPTTTKTRVIARHQQLMRLDDEVTHDLDTEDEHPFIDLLLRFLQREKPQVVIFEDYNKGVLKENVIQRAIAHCNEIGILTAVDPKKNNFMAYKGVTIFKPNLKEVREGLNMAVPVVDLPAMQGVHEALLQELGHKLTFITLSEKGVFFNNGDTVGIIPSHRRNIADVSGAGDTVIATASMVYALTKNATVMAEIANIAGGMVCEEVGVVPINKEQLLAETRQLLS